LAPRRGRNAHQFSFSRRPLRCRGRENRRFLQRTVIQFIGMIRAIRRPGRRLAGASVAAAALVFVVTSATRVRAEYPATIGVYGTQGQPRFTSSIQIPSATYATPSEVRMAIHASGATPSELRANYNRIGPLAMSGPISYVPPAINLYAKLPPTRGNYIGPEAADAAGPSAGCDIIVTLVPPSPAEITVAPGEFSTGAFATSIPVSMRLAPWLDRWLSSAGSSQGRATIGRPSSFSTSLLTARGPAVDRSTP
jgi:hypothetical protein